MSLNLGSTFNVVSDKDEQLDLRWAPLEVVLASRLECVSAACDEQGHER